MVILNKLVVVGLLLYFRSRIPGGRPTGSVNTINIYNMKKINYGKQNSFEILHLLTWQSTLLCPQERGVSSFWLNNLGFG